MQTPDVHKAQLALVDAMRRLQIAERKRWDLHMQEKEASTAVTRLQEEVNEARIDLEKTIADEIDATRSERTS